MKRIFAGMVLLLLCACVCLTTGCAPQEGEAYTFFVPDGAPALAVANVIQSGKIGNHPVTVSIASGDAVKDKCASGAADLAILPTNAAVKICSVNEDYVIFSVNVRGLLYVIGKENISSLKELEGKTVLSIGLANTGEYLFKRILDDAQVAYDGTSGVTLQYYTDGSEAGKLLMAGKGDFALLGEPAATNILNKAQQNGKTFYRVFDLQQLWKDTTGAKETGYPQACVLVKRSALQQKGFAEALTDVLEANAAFLRANVASLNDLLKSVNSALDLVYTQDLLDRCNLTMQKAAERKEEIVAYLQEFTGPFASLVKDEMFYEG